MSENLITNLHLESIVKELVEANRLRKELIKTLIVLGQDKQWI